MGGVVYKNVHSSDIPAACCFCEARHRGVCGALNPCQLKVLSKRASRKTYTAGSSLVRVSEPVVVYSNVLRGVVKLSKLLTDGRQQIVGLQFAPDFLGRPLKSESEHSAEAATGVELCSFPKSTLERLMRESPDLEHSILEQSLRELDEARDWMVTLGRKTAPEKVANFIYMIAVHTDPEKYDNNQQSVSFGLPLSRADIADFLGLTIETVSRQITKLRRAGIIQIENNRNITVPDLDPLQKASGS